MLGTKTGKNLLKIVSEQGLDGLVNLLEEYGLDNFDGLEEMEEVQEEEVGNIQSEGQEELAVQEKKESPKKRFFRRVKK